MTSDSVRKSFRNIFLLLSVLLVSLPAFAQKTASVTLNLKDSSTGENVPFATVSITKKGASSPLKYVLSDNNGKATLEKVSSGEYTLKAELLGYKVYTSEIKVTGTALNLGDVKMDPDMQALEAAKVTDTGNPIIMKKDTIEYNASSFKTGENDVLEDLLKKLPGVEVAEDGSITANGQTISKITIDGKTFFLDDPQLASKNLPSKIIEKVKVVEKKSDQAEFTGISDGQEETVIDLSIKKGMTAKGMMGNVSAGLGHDLLEKSEGTSFSSGDGDYRFQVGGFAGHFDKKNQLSVIFNGNNTNNRNFNDIAGSMMSGMRGGGGMGRGQGGWGGGNGITESWSGGINGNTEFFGGDMKIGGNYFYSNTDKKVREQSQTIDHRSDYDLITNNDGYSRTSTDGHRFGVRLEHKFSESTSILFQPQVNFGSGDYSEFSDFDTQTATASATTNTNKGFNNNIGKNDNWQTDGFLLFRQKLGIPGRTLSAMFRYSFNNNDLDGYNQSLLTTWDDAGVQSDSLTNQRFDQNQKNRSLSGRVTYTEPLGRGFYAEAYYSLSWNKSTSVKDTYDSGDNSRFTADDPVYVPGGEIFNPVYSNDILNRYVNQSIGGDIMYQKDKFHAQVGFSANPTDTHNETNGKTYDSNVVNWSPNAMIWYDMSDFSHIRGFYFGRSSQPSTSQLMPVPDNSNALSVSFGNPYLLPYFTHSFRGDYSFTDRKTFFSLRVDADGSYVNDPIVSARWTGTNGVTYTFPVNGHDSYNGNIGVMLNTPIAKSKFSIMSRTRAGYSKSSSYIGERFDTGAYYTDGDFDYELFHEDFPDLDESSLFQRNTLQSTSLMERLRLTFRNDLVEASVGSRTRMSHSWYSISDYDAVRTWNNQIDFTLNWDFPWGMELNNDFDYNWYNGYTTPQKDEFIMNTEINQTILKKKVVLAVKAWDIFNQSKNLTVTDSESYHKEVRNNTLGRYIIFSVKYNFGSFGRNAGRGGPGGPGGPRPPMGGPPR